MKNINYSQLEVISRRLTRAERAELVLSKELKEISVGLILGDLNVRKLTANSLLQFAQGDVHADYLQHLYKLFGAYCKSAPKTIYSAPDKRTSIW